MAGEDPGSAHSSSAAPERQGLSQLLTRILEQLSVSAWLPATALVFILTLEAKVYRVSHDTKRPITKTLDGLAAGVTSLGRMHLGSLVLLLSAVVLLTMVTQAFDFEVIQLLEGYWGPSRMAATLGTRRAERHERRRLMLQSRLDDLNKEAFAYARQNMIGSHIPITIVNIIEAKRAGEEANGSEKDKRAAEGIVWQEYAKLRHLREREELDVRLQRYPPSYRVLPTRLGNTLRAYEDRVSDPRDRPQGIVMRVFDALPTALQSEVDTYRNRLELYCSLVLVFVLSSLGGIILIDGYAPKAVAIVTPTLLAWLSYRAAVVSARGYGTALLEVGDFLQTNEPAEIPEPEQK